MHELHPNYNLQAIMMLPPGGALLRFKKKTPVIKHSWMNETPKNGSLANNSQEVNCSMMPLNQRIGFKTCNWGFFKHSIFGKKFL
jgi:hypothetical protein